MQLKKRDKPLYTIDEIFEMNGITTPIKENNMEQKFMITIDDDRIFSDTNLYNILNDFLPCAFWVEKAIDVVPVDKFDREKEKYEHLSKSWDELHDNYLEANRRLTDVMEENVRLKETIKKLDDKCRKHLNDSLDYQAKYEFERKKVKKLAAAYVRVKREK